MYWYRRLSHWTPDDAQLFITWRLVGAKDPGNPGQGPRWLADPRIAQIVSEALFHGEGVRRAYDLLAWVIMPDHVHIIIQPKQKLSEIMRWLKSPTANRANDVLGRAGRPFWQREYFDRWIRSDEQLASAIAYVEDNPVRAGLVACSEDWKWSSAATSAGDKIAGATIASRPR